MSATRLPDGDFPRPNSPDCGVTGSRLKVAILVTRMDIGGVPDHIITLLDGFGPDIEPTLVTGSIHQDHHETLQELGVQVELLPMSRTLDPLRDLASFRRLREFLLMGDFDILHSHTSKPALLGAAIGVANRSIRIVNTAHNLGFLAMPEMWKRAIFWAYDKAIAAAGIDATITVSQKVADAVLRARIIGRDRVHVIHNGIRVDRFEQPVRQNKTASKTKVQIAGDPNALLVTCVARLVWFKGLDTLLDGFASVARKEPRAHLALIGDGELENELRQQAGQLNIAERVHFCGERRDVPDILAASDLFVLSSVSEGLPISLMEAMASGLAIVATDVGGVSELVDHETTGLVVEAGDTHALAHAMNTLLADPQRREACGRAGYQRLEEKFSQTAMVSKTEQLYRQLVPLEQQHTADA